MSKTGRTMTDIADRIRLRRTELGLSYQDMADRTGMSKSSLQRYETGGISNIPLHRLKDIAEALEVSPEWLMGWNSQGVLTWSMDFRFSEQETNNIQEHFRELLLKYKKIVNEMAERKNAGGIECQAVMDRIDDAVSWLQHMPTYIDPSLPSVENNLEKELLTVFRTLSDRDKIAWLVRIEDSIDGKI